MASGAPTEIITPPSGGGALSGLGEKFSPDLFTGTANFTVPIPIPPGRNGLQPTLELVYSTGNGNGMFGLGWSLSVPGVTRKTSDGVPRYDEEDTFLLAGSEDLVPVEAVDSTTTRYRPRTEGMFARILQRRDAATRTSYWEVATKEGLTSRYGARFDGGGVDGTTIVTDPADARRCFAWKLAETRDPFGNSVRYDYLLDEGGKDGHSWREPLLERISYVDYTEGDELRFLVTVSFAYEDRPDVFSDYRAGFERRTTQRCRSITSMTHAGQDRSVRRYELEYEQDAFNGLTLLRALHVVGFDDAGDEHRELPPFTFGYTRFEPAGRRFEPVEGAEVPTASLARLGYELLDVTGDGLPDILELEGNGRARFWRNLGRRRFDRPRPMANSPAGVSLADRGVQLLDADGDARADVVVSAGELAGFFPLEFDGRFGRFQKYERAPTFDLEDPDVRLIDLDGDGVTDAVRSGARLECFFNDPRLGWRGPVLAPTRLDGLRFSDPRVKWADMSGDGLQDLVLVHDAHVEYCPNLGYGRFGPKLPMGRSPRFPTGYDPRRVLLGDIDGDGLADVVYVGARRVCIWFNRSGGAFSDPVEVEGTPPGSEWDSIQLVDLRGGGVAGVLWSREQTANGRASMYFLDLTGGTRPRLLSEIDNGMGTATRVDYVSSSEMAVADAARPSTRWRTSLPFPVHVIARVTTFDAVSGGKLVTQYRYRHGYWDGLEREFRGFAYVEQLSTETFDAYHARARDGPEFADVDHRHFAPPTLLKTWFHLGAVEEADGDWHELDLSGEYWRGDPGVLRHSERVERFLRTLSRPGGGSDRRARRDAVRALRGNVLRTELYALDGTERRERPYTVVEHAYDVRDESSPTLAEARRIFFPFVVAQRTTQWERGDDPMTRFGFTDDYDVVGQARRETTVAMPRRSEKRSSYTTAVQGVLKPDETRVLATQIRTEYAQPTTDAYIHDRVAHLRTFELVDQPTVVERDPADLQAVLEDQARTAEAVVETFDRSSAGEVRLVGHVLNHYDGPAFTGLGPGDAGTYGALTRTEALVLTDDVLDAAYGPERPSYLGGTETPAPGTPAGFGGALGYHLEQGDAEHAAGHYADSVRRSHDFQASTAAAPLPARGLLAAVQDTLGNETSVEHDEFGVLPTIVRDAVALESTAEYDYRVFQPRKITDANGHATNFRYTPVGLLAAVFLQTASGGGGSEAKPEVRYDYDFLGMTRPDREPIAVHTTTRLRHASDGVSDATIEVREYSDGFGRVVQKRAQADELAFGDWGDDAGLLVPDAEGRPQAVPGAVSGPASGSRIGGRVVVSGWQVYDNRGRAVEKYEPFFSQGWDFQPEVEAKHGRHLELSYDARDRLVRTLNPDGSERRDVIGVPDPDWPDGFEPTPWESFSYDENDLAPISTDSSGSSLAASAPTAHHLTPATDIVDALGRTICRIRRNGASPASDWFAARSTYDIRGNTLTVTDELGRIAFAYVHDLANRPLRVDSIDAGTTTSILDARGALVESRDLRGARTLQVYDRLNRLSRVHARDGPTEALTVREELEYGDGGNPAQAAAERAQNRTASRLGRLFRHHDEAGLVVFESYDAPGNVLDKTRQVVSDTALAQGWRVDWAAANSEDALDSAVYRSSVRYDALNRAIEATMLEDGTGVARKLEFRYGRSGALEAIGVDGSPYVDPIAYNARGQRVFAAYGNGVMTRYAYDPDTFRLVRLRSEAFAAASDVWTGTGQPLQELTYAHDLVGNVRTIEDRTPGCGVAGTPHGRNRLVRTFVHDALYRLTEATGRECTGIPQPRPLGDDARCGSYPAPYVLGPPAPSQANAPDLTSTYTERYEHDPVGNVHHVRHTSDGATWSRAFGLDGKAPDDWANAGRNRMTSIVQGGSTTTLLYDDAGNTIQQDTSRTYDWDHRSRLVAFATQTGAAPSLQARYLYGADGARVKKWVRRGATSANDESTVYLDELFEHTRWSRDGGGENRLLHVRDGETLIALVRDGSAHPLDAGPPIRFRLADHVGSYAVEVRDDGQWINREEYFPFGETSFGSFSRKRYRFAGRERDEESGLVVAAARQYAPWALRWLSADPAGPVDGLNLYAYARGSPVTLVDQSGLQSEPAAADQPAAPATHVVIVGTDFKKFNGEWFHKDKTNFPATAKQVLLQDTVEGVRQSIAPGDTVVVIVPADMQKELKDDLQGALAKLRSQFAWSLTPSDEPEMFYYTPGVSTEFVEIPSGRDMANRVAQAVNKLENIRNLVYVGHGVTRGPMFHDGSSSTFPSPDKFDRGKFAADARAVFISCNSESYAEKVTKELHIRAEGTEGESQFEVTVDRDPKTGREVSKYRVVRGIVDKGTTTVAWDFKWERGRVVRMGPLNIMRKTGTPYALPQTKRGDPFRSAVMGR